MNINVLNQNNPNNNRNLSVETKEARALNMNLITTREDRRNRRLNMDCFLS